MKKIMLFVMFIGFVAFPMFAQEVEPPGNWGEVIDGFGSWFGSLALIAALTIFVAGVLNGVLKVTKKFPKQLIAWLVAVGLACLGNLINLGFLAEATWLMTVLYGFGAGLVANGLFDVAIVHAIILAVESALNKDK
ncbi:hypothetical protein LCGC14_1650850 [marine sediment metagenome]|uniref:Uncharacterized protein n=1 Tax=marine sediment metagenome TaxID=412755 RepID=A0A0F9KX30_9ZZZZ